MYWLHPIIVHFVIASLSIAVIFDFLALVSQKHRYQKLTRILLIVGTLCAVIAVLSGFEASEKLHLNETDTNLLNQHKLSGQLTMWIFIALTLFHFLRLKVPVISRKLKWAYYALAFVSLIFLFRTGLFGGELAYVRGVGVKRESSQQGNSRPPVFEFEADTTSGQQDYY